MDGGDPIANAWLAQHGEADWHVGTNAICGQRRS